MDEQYLLASDNSGHTYLVPLSRKVDWEKWCNLPEDDEDAWDAPEYATKVEGELLTFTNPKLNGKPLSDG